MKSKLLLGLAALAGLLFGYHLGVIGPSLPLLSQAHLLSTWESAHIVSVFLIGLMGGSMVSSWLTDLAGRKRALFIWAFVLMVGAVIGAQARTFASLISYRVLTGVGVGMIGAVVPLVLVENGTVISRGRLNCIFQVFIATGVGLSYLIGLICLPFKSYNAMFIAPFFLEGLVLMVVWKIRLVEPKRVKENKLELRKYARSYLVAFGLNFFQQAVGINAVTFFAQSIFSDYQSSTPLLAYKLALGMNAMAILGTLWTMRGLEKFGRRKFLQLGALGMGIGMLIMAFTVTNPYQGFVGLALFTLSFGVSFGPMVYLMMNEVFPDSLRARGAALSFLVGGITNYLISLSFLPLEKSLGINALWIIFSGMSLLAFIFVRKVVPETAGKKTEQVVKELNHLG